MAVQSENLLPSTDNTISLGSNSKRWSDVYALEFHGTATTAGTVTTAAQPNITSLGTLTTLTVDDITINGSTISDAGDLTLDVGGDIILDANGRDIKFLQGGTQYMSIFNDVSNNAVINSIISNKDIIFSGVDGSTNITALTLDMSDAGKATFNNGLISGGLTATTTLDVSSTSVFDNNIAFGLSAVTFASGNGMHFADNFKAGFGTGNGTRPDFQISGDNSGLAIACGTGADTVDVLITTEGAVGVGLSNPSEKIHAFGSGATISAKVETDDVVAAELAPEPATEFVVEPPPPEQSAKWSSSTK